MQDENGDRLLVIDDEPAFGRIVKTIAERAGFAVKATEEPEEFELLAQSWHPSVIFMDLQIPGTDGVELLRKLTARRCDAWVILASGLDGKTLDAARRLGLERGLKMAGTVQKPSRSSVIRKLLTRCKRADGALSAAELAEGIAAGQLFLEYQPKLDCNRRRIAGVEALVRWRHPVRGLVRPDQFIPLAESNDLIQSLTDWVLSAALAQCAAWCSGGLALELSINISAKDLAIDFPDRLAQRCREFGIAPDSVILELTETSATRDAVQMMDVLTRLRVKGFRLSIDDFGTGHSSMLQLQRMPFSELKIDRSFVMNMLGDKDSRVIVEIVIDLARKLRLHSVAEGVETDATLQGLVALECDGLQGYHLSRPLAPERIASFVTEYEARTAVCDVHPASAGDQDKPRRTRSGRSRGAAPAQPAIIGAARV
ncbi:MAG: EAL domain-containing response regulator [Alphaproteobacteria bacterium]|nr:EAL domain-containing response regulator [Alphaproteobacteria bacterium]